MKKSRCSIVKLLILVLVFCLLPATTAEAKKTRKPKAPKIAKTVVIQGYSSFLLDWVYDGDDTGHWTTSLGHFTEPMTLPIKNLSKNAELLPLRETDADVDGGFDDGYRENINIADYEIRLYPQSISKKFSIGGFLSLIGNSPANPGRKFPFGFKIRQNDTTYELHTNFKISYKSLAKKVVINGKKVNLRPVRKGLAPTIALPKDGILKKASISFVKGYKKMGVFIKRINPNADNSDNPLLRIPFTKGMTLQRGDIISFEYMKKDWRKSESFDILVQ